MIEMRNELCKGGWFRYESKMFLTNYFILLNMRQKNLRKALEVLYKQYGNFTETVLDLTALAVSHFKKMEKHQAEFMGEIPRNASCVGKCQSKGYYLVHIVSFCAIHALTL